MQLSSVHMGNWEEIKHWPEVRLAFVGKKRIFICRCHYCLFQEAKRGSGFKMPGERERGFLMKTPQSTLFFKADVMSARVLNNHLL